MKLHEPSPLANVRSLLKASAVGFFLTAGLNVCFAQNVPSDWKSDCVGRMQISLPGAVDIAATSVVDFLKGKSNPSSEFDDGQAAPYSSYQYGGVVYVTRTLTAEERRRMVATANEWKGRNEKKAKGARKTAGPDESPTFESLPLSGKSGAAWRNRNRFDAIMDIDGHGFSWGVSVDDNQMADAKGTFATMMSGLSPRPMFSVPNASGVCLPHAFIRDNGSDNDAGRLVGITYRLQAHPDVTIWLQDASAAAIEDFQDPAKFTAVYKSNFFWTQRYQSPKSKQSLLNGSYNKIQFAGQGGIETMMKLIREDDTEDYGYLVATRGKRGAKEDTPDLMMYVIRDAKNARAKGIEPLDKKAFFEMAQSIAASVKYRAVK